MKNKNWIKSPWTISIGTAIFSLILTIGYDYFKNKPILSTIWQILRGVTNFIISVLNLNLKVWWLIVGIIVIITIIYLIDKFKKKETFKPDFYSYKEEKLKRWKWTWNWNYSKNAWAISDLTAHCPDCDTPLIHYINFYELKFDCPRCDFRARGSQCDEPYKIGRIIMDNVERKRRNANT